MTIILKEKFAAEITKAQENNMNYAEVSEDGENIHFCAVDNASTPIGWSWSPNCIQFWI